MNKAKTYLTLILVLSALCAMAQKPNGKVRDGNRQYKREHYDRAEIEYRKALDIDSTYYKSHYNLGNTLYRNKNYTEAARHYTNALESPSLTTAQRSSTLHNLGNSYLQQGLADKANGMENFQKAVNNYIEALKIDPNNDDTRYNLSYAMKMLQQAQQQQQNNGGDGDDNKQDQQNNQQQSGNQQQRQDEQNDQGQQNQQGEQKPDDRKQQQDTKQNKAEQQQKQDAERLLEAVKNNERQTLKEQQKQVQTGKPIKIDKDW